MRRVDWQAVVVFDDLEESGAVEVLAGYLNQVVHRHLLEQNRVVEVQHLQHLVHIPVVGGRLVADSSFDCSQRSHIHTQVRHKHHYLADTSEVHRIEVGL